MVHSIQTILTQLSRDRPPEKGNDKGMVAFYLFNKCKLKPISFRPISQIILREYLAHLEKTLETMFKIQRMWDSIYEVFRNVAERRYKTRSRSQKAYDPGTSVQLCSCLVVDYVEIHNARPCACAPKSYWKGPVDVIRIKCWISAAHGYIARSCTCPKSGISFRVEYIPEQIKTGNGIPLATQDSKPCHWLNRRYS